MSLQIDRIDDDTVMINGQRVESIILHRIVLLKKMKRYTECKLRVDADGSAELRWTQTNKGDEE